ncbi:MAG: ABC transporter permease [Micropruina sp.]|uniref:ABC transporter permease n=1 Tax=Micropruina sp. TaxID=2737536 RepID=UPI0039E6703F
MTSGVRQAAWNSVVALVTDAMLSLTAKPLRTLGMASGIMLAITSCTAAIMIADTQQVQIDRRFDLQRSAAVVITAQTAPDGFQPAAIASIAALEPVATAGELSIWSDQVTVAANAWTAPSTASLLAADAGGLAVGGRTTLGADAQLLSVDRPLVWLGSGLAARLGVRDLRRPQTVEIDSRRYGVAGIVTANPGFDYLDTSVVLSRASAARIVPAARTTRLVAAIRPGAASAVGDYALAVLDPTRSLGLVDVTPPDGEILLGGVAGDLHLIGLTLGGFIGLVGIVAVANTMSMSVAQRARELGLRSAMGWKPGRIRALILLESGITGALAATAGCVLGIGIAIGWSLSQEWTPILDRRLPMVLVIAGTLAALVGGLIPAQHAATTSPLEAMRS